MNKEALSKKMSELKIEDEKSPQKSVYSPEEIEEMMKEHMEHMQELKIKDDTENDTVQKQLKNIKAKSNKDKEKTLFKKVLVGFTHGIYATILAGGYKGYEAEIKEYIPEKLILKLKDNKKIYINKNLVKQDKKNKFRYIIQKGKMKGQSGMLVDKIPSKSQVLVNNIPHVVNTIDLFYHDITIKGDITCSVSKIERDGNTYKLFVNTIDGKEKVISLQDIKLYLLGFRIKDQGSEVKEDDQDQDQQEYTFESDERIDTDDIYDDDSESVGEVQGYGDGEGDEDNIEDNDNGEMKMSYKDIERLGKIVQKIQGKKKDDYNYVKKILTLNNENESSVNTYKILDEADDVFKYISKKIESKGVNFNVYKSVIDRKMILSVLTAYEMIVSDDANFRGLEKYINVLYKGNYFKLSDISTSSMLVKTDIFPCEFADVKTKVLVFNEMDKIKSAVLCFNNIIKRVLNKDIDLESIEEVIDDINAVPIVSQIKETKGFKTIDELLSTNAMISFKDLVLGNGEDKILLGTKFENCLKIYRLHLMEYITDPELSKIQRSLYKFVHDNLDANNINKVIELQNEVVNIISSQFNDFNQLYNECEMDVKDYFSVNVCKDNIILSYIENYSQQRNNMENLKTLLKYKEFIRLSKEFISFLKECYVETGEYKSQKVRNIMERLETIKRKRDLEYEYNENKNEWVKKQK